MESKLYNKSRIWVHSVHISIGTFVFFYTLAVFNSCSDNVIAWIGISSSSEMVLTLYNVVIPAGQCIGSILSAFMMEKFGRRISMILLDCLYIVGSLVLIVPNLYCFGIGRLLTGIAAGALDPISCVFSTEITPEPMMSQIGGFNVIFASLGFVFAFGLALILPDSNFSQDPLNALWIVLFIFPALLCAYQILFFYTIMNHDSAQFYMSKKMMSKVKTALVDIYKEESTYLGLRRVNSEFEGKVIEGNTLTLRKMCCAKKFRKMIRIGISLALLEVLSGIDTLTFYSTDLLTFVGSSLFVSRIITFVLGITNLLSCLLSLPLMKYFERKVLLTVGMFLISIDLLVLSLFSGYIFTSQIASFIILALYFLCFGFSMGSVVWVYLYEVLNDQIFSLACFFSYVFRMIVVFCFPIAIQGLGVSNTFIFFSASMLAGSFYSYFDLVNTKNVEKEEILFRLKVFDYKIKPHVIETKKNADNNSEKNINERSDLKNRIEFDLDSSKRSLR